MNVLTIQEEALGIDQQFQRTQRTWKTGIFYYIIVLSPLKIWDWQLKVLISLVGPLWV